MENLCSGFSYILYRVKKIKYNIYGVYMLLNISNHPSDKWSSFQKEAANIAYGRVIDIPFPEIVPTAELEEITIIAASYLNQISEIIDENSKEEIYVHIMGEFTFTYLMIEMLKKIKIKCFASTTQRNVIENSDNTKTVLFQFVKFRPYFHLAK